MADSSPSYNNVVSVTFATDSNAYEALTRLKELDTQGQVDLNGAAVVARGEDGQLSVRDELEDERLRGTAGGGLVGLLIGILGGPLGILIGGATGLVVGSLFDIHDADETESVLGDISASIKVGSTALIADVTEQSPEVVDTAMASLAGTVLRRSVADVEAEIAAAEKAQRAAKKEARKELRKARHKKHQDKVHAEVQELKSKLPHKQKAVAVDQAPAPAEKAPEPAEKVAAAAA